MSNRKKSLFEKWKMLPPLSVRKQQTRDEKLAQQAVERRRVFDAEVDAAYASMKRKENSAHA